MCSRNRSRSWSRSPGARRRSSSQRSRSPARSWRRRPARGRSRSRSSSRGPAVCGHWGRRVCSRDRSRSLVARARDRSPTACFLEVDGSRARWARSAEPTLRTRLLSARNTEELHALFLTHRVQGACIGVLWDKLGNCPPNRVPLDLSTQLVPIPKKNVSVQEILGQKLETQCPAVFFCFGWRSQKKVRT